MVHGQTFLEFLLYGCVQLMAACIMYLAAWAVIATIITTVVYFRRKSMRKTYNEREENHG